MHQGKAGSIIFICFLLLLCRLAPAQEDTIPPLQRIPAADTLYPPDTAVDFKTIDSVSYQLYLEAKWKELIRYGRQAIRLGYDYYYLRMRLGIACFELKACRAAVAHFEKALSFNAGDDVAMNYLYQCYLYTERYEDAKWLSRSFSPELAASKKSGRFSAIDLITLESGFKVSDSARLFRPPFFTSLALSHSICRRVFLLHSAAFYRQNEARFNVDQLQYYLRATLPLKHGFEFSAGFHFVHVDSDIKSNLETVSTRTYEVGGFPGGPPPRTVVETTVLNTPVITNRRSSNYIGAMSLTRHFVFMDAWIGATFAQFDTIQQYQANAGLAFYPLKNNRLSFGSALYLHYERETQLAIAPYVSAYLTPRLNLLINYFQNQGPNISEATGYFVSNSIDYTRQRLALTASVKINTGIWAYGTCGYEKKLYFNGAYEYNYYVFVAGLRISPQFR